jgi:hypothetical protein
MDPTPGETNLPVPVEPRPVELADVAVQSVRAAFGVTALALEILWRSVGAAVPALRDPNPPATGTPVAVEALLGTAWTVVGAGGRAVDASVRVARPAVAFVADLPLLPQRVRPGALVARAAGTWRAERPTAVAQVAQWSSSMAPDTADLAVRMVDVDAVVAAVVRRVDVTAVATEVVSQVDVDRVARAVIERLDLQGLVDEVLAELDLDAIVLEHVDLGRVVEAALDKLDLTALVTERVDLGVVIDDALDQMDLTQLVMERVDLPKVAEYVVDEIDLPGIVRESTQSIAAGTVTGIRLQSLDADQAVSRIVDRVLLRRRARRTKSRAQVDGAESPESVETRDAGDTGAPEGPA